MTVKTTTYYPKLIDIRAAVTTLKDVVTVTPLTQNINYSREFAANIFLKREDLQQVRSYKIRGAYNKISSLTPAQLERGIVCASAGNHAQGVAFACHRLKIHGTIYMPTTTPRQKLEQVEMFGGEYVTIQIIGDTFDDAQKEAAIACELEDKTFVHPFNDPKIIEGQGTVGLEILEQAQEFIDYVFVPVGGGGLAAGLASVFKMVSPKTKIIGVEPQGAPSMKTALEKNKNIRLPKIEKFIDGASVQQVGNLTFDICRQYLDAMITVPEGKVCQTILDVYNKDAIVVEPAGALTIAALDVFADQIKGKNVVCIVSGSNNDITRTAEIKERALLFNGLKHYFIVRFPQRAGALKEFVAEVLGTEDDITHFEYSKKNNRENAPAVVGVELKQRADLIPLIQRMKERNFYGDYLNDKPDLFQYLV